MSKTLYRNGNSYQNGRFEFEGKKSTTVVSTLDSIMEIGVAYNRGVTGSGNSDREIRRISVSGDSIKYSNRNPALEINFNNLSLTQRKRLGDSMLSGDIRARLLTALEIAKEGVEAFLFLQRGGVSEHAKTETRKLEEILSDIKNPDTKVMQVK